MNAKTLEALKASIAKWEANAETARTSFSDGSKVKRGPHAQPGVIGVGPDDCPLCEMFVDDACEGCPVFEETGEIYCESTPYVTVFHQTAFVPRRADGSLVTACEAEVAFLRTLLPAGA